METNETLEDRIVETERIIKEDYDSDYLTVLLNQLAIMKFLRLIEKNHKYS